MKKKVFALVMLLVLVLSLTGCGISSEKDEEPTIDINENGFRLNIPPESSSVGFSFWYEHDSTTSGFISKGLTEVYLNIAPYKKFGFIVTLGFKAEETSGEEFIGSSNYGICLSKDIKFLIGKNIIGKLFQKYIVEELFDNKNPYKLDLSVNGEENYVYMISDGDNHSIGYRFADGSSEEESTYE